MSLLTLLIVDFKKQMTHLLLYVDGPTVHKKISIMHVPTVSLASSWTNLSASPSPSPFIRSPSLVLSWNLHWFNVLESHESVNVSRIFWRKPGLFPSFLITTKQTVMEKRNSCIFKGKKAWMLKETRCYGDIWESCSSPATQKIIFSSPLSHVSFDQEDDSFLTFCLLLDSYKKTHFCKYWYDNKSKRTISRRKRK